MCACGGGEDPGGELGSRKGACIHCISTQRGAAQLGGKAHSSTGRPHTSGWPESEIYRAAAFSGLSLSLTWRRRQPSSTWGSDSAHSWIACISGAIRCGETAAERADGLSHTASSPASVGPQHDMTGHTSHSWQQGSIQPPSARGTTLRGRRSNAPPLPPSFLPSSSHLHHRHSSRLEPLQHHDALLSVDQMEASEKVQRSLLRNQPDGRQTLMTGRGGGGAAGREEGAVRSSSASSAPEPA